MSIINFRSDLKDLTKRAEISAKLQVYYKLIEHLNFKVIETTKELNQLNLKESKNENK
jgi:hypothetical protein